MIWGRTGQRPASYLIEIYQPPGAQCWVARYPADDAVTVAMGTRDLPLPYTHHALAEYVREEMTAANPGYVVRHLRCEACDIVSVSHPDHLCRRCAERLAPDDSNLLAGKHPDLF